jgi:cysteinyl-tRNA synthetase
MTEIKLYNTATRSKDVFTPLDPQNVRMYVCGPTVYDRAHLGNARPALVFDVLYRLLRHVYGPDHVTYVRNITDVDDKINAEAQRRKAAGASGTLEELIAERAEETIRWYHEDMDALGVLRPTHEPRATDYIAQMIAMIEGLIADGYAYENEGHVLFRVRKYADYGKLSGRSVDDMIAGARVEVAPYKEDPMDFVLWKPSSDELPGWESPWGRGRPGWHIECSAMAAELLGESFDIHGGGNDLQFPHHENEIAQSKCAGHGFAKVWMHNEMLQVEGKKMSKSLGNFFTVRDMINAFDRDFAIANIGPAIRLRMLQSHYRSPVEAGVGYIEQASTKLGQWWFWTSPIPDLEPSENERRAILANSKFLAAVCNDLNTPKAISIIDELVESLKIQPANNSIVNDWADDQISIARAIVTFIEFLGINFKDLKFLHHSSWQARLRAREAGDNGEVKSLIESLLRRRGEARKQKDFVTADQIRDALAQANVILKDTPTGVEWELGAGFNAKALESLK